MENRNRNSFKELTHLGLLKTCFDRVVNSKEKIFHLSGPKSVRLDGGENDNGIEREEAVDKCFTVQFDRRYKFGF